MKFCFDINAIVMLLSILTNFEKIAVFMNRNVTYKVDLPAQENRSLAIEMSFHSYRSMYVSILWVLKFLFIVLLSNWFAILSKNIFVYKHGCTWFLMLVKEVFCCWLRSLFSLLGRKSRAWRGSASVQWKIYLGLSCCERSESTVVQFVKRYCCREQAIDWKDISST